MIDIDPKPYTKTMKCDQCGHIQKAVPVVATLPSEGENRIQLICGSDFSFCEVCDGPVEVVDVMREAALLVEQAIGEVDDIFDARPQTYADPDEHSFNARRKMTMKDAKPKAKRAANYLRQAWELLDPSIK